jgi:hypothetical protein
MAGCPIVASSKSVNGAPTKALFAKVRREIDCFVGSKLLLTLLQISIQL